jgi:hypothetical protein
MAGEAWALGALTLVLWIVSGFQLLGKMQGWDETMLALGALYPPYFRQGFWWTPLTHIFLHAGLLHIVMNTSALVSLGPAIAVRLGRDLKGALLFWAFFLICGLAGGLLFLVLHWNGEISGRRGLGGDLRPVGRGGAADAGRRFDADSFPPGRQADLVVHRHEPGADRHRLRSWHGVGAGRADDRLGVPRRRLHRRAVPGRDVSRAILVACPARLSGLIAGAKRPAAETPRRASMKSSISSKNNERRALAPHPAGH